MFEYRFIYLRNNYSYLEKSCPVGCVAISFNKSSNIVSYQVSVLNPADDFDRGMARQLALGRLVEEPFIVVTPVNSTMHNVTKEIMLDIRNNSALHKRARRAASAWLNRIEKLSFDSLVDSKFYGSKSDDSFAVKV